MYVLCSFVLHAATLVVPVTFYGKWATARGVLPERCVNTRLPAAQGQNPAVTDVAGLGGLRSRTPAPVPFIVGANAEEAYYCVGVLSPIAEARRSARRNAYWRMFCAANLIFFRERWSFGGPCVEGFDGSSDHVMGQTALLHLPRVVAQAQLPTPHEAPAPTSGRAPEPTHHLTVTFGFSSFDENGLAPQSETRLRAGLGARSAGDAAGRARGVARGDHRAIASATVGERTSGTVTAALIGRGSYRLASAGRAGRQAPGPRWPGCPRLRQAPASLGRRARPLSVLVPDPNACLAGRDRARRAHWTSLVRAESRSRLLATICYWADPVTSKFFPVPLAGPDHHRLRPGLRVGRRQMCACCAGERVNAHRRHAYVLLSLEDGFSVGANERIRDPARHAQAQDLKPPPLSFVPVTCSLVNFGASELGSRFCETMHCSHLEADIDKERTNSDVVLGGNTSASCRTAARSDPFEAWRCTLVANSTADFVDPFRAPTTNDNRWFSVTTNSDLLTAEMLDVALSQGNKF
ncbi:hypothetical protein BKA93DRAFT_752214 [Sparassis latifolia]